MASYYDSNKATIANARLLHPSNDEQQHFPSEGLYLGELTGGSVELPALYDLSAGKGLCLLYTDTNGRDAVNRLLERLAWRIALTVPSNLCDIILYNGGNPGDAFNAHTRINKYVFDNRADRVFFDGKADEFRLLMNEVYASIVDRMSTIRLAGKKDLVELNESLGKEARLKYQFIILTDFPRHIRTELAQRLSQIIEAGPKAGIYVMMSWDMAADLEDASNATSFNAQQMLGNMQMLVPAGDGFQFRNSGHDDVFNRFIYVMDCNVPDMTEIESLLQKIDIYVETAKKAAKPSILKQDFDSLEENAYEPVMSEINVTVGLDVRDKHPVTFRFNSGDYIHGFILGQSGSGKSVLLNNIITSAILKYSPQDLMLYLMDFKGVEFNKYRGLKHTKAVLVDNSDPQMTLEVLRELKDENKKRVKLWQKEGVSNIDGYNKKYPENRLPQVLFVADECQVMFRRSTGSTDIAIQREIAEILDIIATQGRSQGIHMLLATQQLDETDISGQILKNLTECFLLMSAPGDAERLVPDSSDLTSKQMTGLACYYHKKELQSQVQTFFAPDDELTSAISAAQQKASALPGNGEHYFSGSSMFTIDEEEKNRFFDADTKYPTAFIGHDIGIKSELTAIPLPRDFCENILFFGANKEGQTAGVAVSALQSLTIVNPMFNVKVIDCYDNPNAKYRELLEKMQADGLCEIIERRNSGELLRQLANDISKQQGQETILLILGSERFAEMKRNSPLISNGATTINSDKGFDISSGVVSMDFFCDDNGDTSAFTEQIEQQAQTYATFGDGDDTADDVVKTFPEALRFILDEGPTQGVHILLQTDKPTNILFEDYPSETVAMFKHKVILRSENKYLTPMRFSVDIDVEVLGDEEERLRAFYYPEDGGPRLFTPYIIIKE